MGGTTTPESQGAQNPSQQSLSASSKPRILHSTPMDGASFPFGDVDGDGALVTPVSWGAGDAKAPQTGWDEAPTGPDFTGAENGLNESADGGVRSAGRNSQLASAEGEEETEVPAVEAPGVQRSQGVFPILNICLDHQDGSSAEKAILDHAALLALLETASAPVIRLSGVSPEATAHSGASGAAPNLGGSESDVADEEISGDEADGGPSVKVVGMLGHKGTM